MKQISLTQGKFAIVDDACEAYLRAKHEFLRQI